MGYKKVFFILSYFAAILAVPSIGDAQNLTAAKNTPPFWQAQKENLPGKIKAFEENKGQYPDVINGAKILYGCFYGGVTILFTEKGLTYDIKQLVKLKESADQDEKRENIQEEQEEKERARFKTNSFPVSIGWENSNSLLQVESEEETPYYFGNSKGEYKGFRKLIYRNVYPGIDVVFSFHKEDGIKYDVLVRPGADLSAFTMKYSGHKGLRIDASGNLHIKTPLGDIIDHAPVSRQNGKEINSSFQKTDNDLVQFKFDAIDPSKELIIDPWLTSPTIGTAGFAPVNCGVDANNNVYILGAYSPASWDIRQFVQKYNTAGVLQWTYQLTEFQGTNGDYWLSDLAVSPAGDSYIASQFQFSRAAGCGGNEYAMVSLNPNGTRKYFYCGAGTNGSIFETWNLAYDCSFSKLIQAGCAPSPNNTAQACVVNIATGSINPITRNNTIGEIYAGTIAPNGYYYALAADSNINATTYTATSGPHNKVMCYQITGTAMSLLWWTNTNYTFVDFTSHMPLSLGTNGIGVGCNYLYTSDGTNLDQRNINTGALIKRVTITGGSTVGPNINSGIAVDPLCGNVYVGSKSAIYTYDQNLNVLSTYTVGANNIVFDVKVKNGIVSFCGATKSTGSAPSETVGVGFVGQFTAAICASPLGITHTNAGTGCPGSATANPTFCAAPYSYLWMPTGQTTQTATGLSPGTYTVTVSSQNTCLTVQDTVTIFSANCGGPTVTVTGGNICVGNCTSVTANASSGASPYAYLWNPGGQTTSSITVCPSATTVYSVTITDASSATATSTATVTINSPPTATVSSPQTICASSSATITGGGGGTYLWSPGGQTTSSITVSPTATSSYSVVVTNASGCKDTVSTSITVTPGINPTVTPALICAGDSAVITASGGTTYSWSTGGTTSSITVSPSVTTSYTVLVTAGSCSATAVATLTVSTGINAGISGNTSLCAGSSTTLTATGGTSFSWSTGGTSASIVITPTSSGSYSVVVSSGTCKDSTGITVNVNPTPTAVVSSATICAGSPATLSASGGTSYSWSPGGASSSSITVSPTSTANYTVTVTAPGGCTDAASTTVTVNQAPITSINGNTSLCSGQSTTLTASGGGVYSWNTGATTAAINLTPGTSTGYTVVVTNASGCTAAAYTTVLVSPTPTATISSPSTICAGKTLTLTATGGGNYSWIPGGNSTPSITVSPGTSANYSVIVSMGGCSDTASTAITVNTSPTASISGNILLCKGDPTTLLATGGGAYSWSNGSTTASINLSPSSSTNYTVTVTNAGGCTATATVAVTVSNPPVATINSTTICAGQTATLTATGGGNYLWNTGQSSASIVVSPTAAASYSVIVSIGTCTSTATASVTVNPNPTATAYSNVTITQGQSTTLSATGGISYTWSNGSLGSNITVNPFITTIYCVTVKNAYGCQDSACVKVVVEPIDCSVNATGELFIPNAFSPNDDGQNEVIRLFYGNYSCIKEYKFVIYNRWGQKIFETTNALDQWDGSYKGKREDTAVFAWYMQVELIDGKKIERKGNISLVR